MQITIMTLRQTVDFIRVKIKLLSFSIPILQYCSGFLQSVRLLAKYCPFLLVILIFSLESVWANKKDRMAWILKEIACFKETLLYYECSVNNLSTFWSMITEAQPETCQQKKWGPPGWQVWNGPVLECVVWGIKTNWTPAGSSSSSSALFQFTITANFHAKKVTSLYALINAC